MERAIQAPAATPPAHVAIIGLGPSASSYFSVIRKLGSRRAYADEVWGINCAADIYRCDRVFHMDDMLVQEARAAEHPGGNIAAMVDWLRGEPGPVYTSRQRDGYPGLVEFPLEDVLRADYDNSGGNPYFNSTAAYAIVYAIHIGVKRISLFGIDYTLPNIHSGERGRACCEYWLGVAAARGIAVTVPETSTLIDACAPPRELLYGFDCVDVAIGEVNGNLSVSFTDRTAPSAAEIEARYDHSQHPNRLLREPSKET